MESNRLLLQQEKHFESVMDILHTFSKTNILTDCLLIAENHQIAVHRQVLSSVTTYFEALVPSQNVHHCCFIFENYHKSIFEKLAEFLYCGVVVVNEIDVIEFHKIMELLKIINFQSASLPSNGGRIFTLKSYRESFVSAVWSSRLTLVENYMVFVTRDCSETKAHTVVMCANSKYIFNAFVKQQGKTKPLTLLLDNVEQRHLDKVIEFCYKGSVYIEPEMLADVYAVSCLLGVESLSKLICDVDPLIQFPRKKEAAETISSVKTLASLGTFGSNSIYRDIFENEHLVDFIIVAGNVSYSVHLAVLSEYSPYFRSLIKKCTVIKDSYLLVKDLNEQQVQSFVQYVYMGETEFQGNTEEFSALMKEWIDFEKLPISESKERLLLPPHSVEKPSLKLKCRSVTSLTHKSLMMSCSAPTVYNEESLSCNRDSSASDHFNVTETEWFNVDLKEEDDVPRDDTADPESDPLEPLGSRRSRVCHVCSVVLKTRAAFRAHLSVHPLSCRVCDKLFSRPSQLALHERTHSGAKPHQCPVCGRAFSAKSSVTKHLATHGDDKFLCDICNKGFSRKQYIEEHLRTHTGNKPYKCSVCPKTFVGKTGLNHHMKTHNGVKGAVCEVCGKSFTRHGLWTHMKSHNKTFECVICHKFFATGTSLRQHNLGSHLGQRGQQCHTCGKSFVQRNHLVRHMKVHRKVETLVYSCETCGRTYKSEAKLQSHVETEHIAKEERRYTCDVCPKWFAGRSSLIYHQRAHTGLRPHSCELCGKMFTRPDALQVHKLTHQARQPSHPCGRCGDTFTTKAGLKRHRELSHIQTECKCSICDRTFKCEKKLLNHIANHSQNKFHCEICRKEFRWEANLKKHLTNVHSVSVISAELPPMYSFEVCGSTFEAVGQYAGVSEDQPVRRPFSIDMDGNLCCNDAPTERATAPLLDVAMCALDPHHDGS